MTYADEVWRLEVIGEATGCGFAVTPTRALTCAHLIGPGQRHCRVASLPGTRAVAVPSAYDKHVNPIPDIATIDISGHPTDAVAPMGPATRPTAGAVLDLFGLPDRGREGRRSQARVSGPSRTGEWIQIDAVHGHTAWVEPGFSGGAATDAATGLVVGMVVSADRSLSERSAWVIPNDTIVESTPWLAAVLADPLTGDPDYVALLRSLNARRYTAALDRLPDLHSRHRRSSDLYYYWAIVLLQGVRPANHSGEVIDGIERLLGEACRLDSGSAHAQALLALVREDYYGLRSLPMSGRDDHHELTASHVTSGRATEIISHVPATECLTWRSLYRRSMG
ncbi:trypsin-like peptidase domain-containing protein [Micromonospora sp. D93]|nr:trypsin-like peptidase domain-containing protein [Micromonospora sp. D93]